MPHLLKGMRGLKRHFKTLHEKLKEYKCEVCEKEFGQLSSLQTHVKIVHKKLKKHKCQVCEKGLWTSW